MKVRQTLMFLTVLSALLLQACGASGDAIATGIAQTQQISDLETAAAGGGGAVQPSAEVAQPSNTPAPSVALVSVSQNTNCRSGPRQDYSLLTTINVGQQVEVLKTFSNDYVLVKNPNGSGDCWLFLQYADTTDFSAFDLVAATQPPTPKAPPTVEITTKVNLDQANFQTQGGSTCPVQLVWRGLITVSGPVEITYRWERSDGTHTDRLKLTFTEFGTQEVSDVFDFGAGVVPDINVNYTVGDQLKILLPIQVSSSDDITFSCDPL
jgi:hypothetical protein